MKKTTEHYFCDICGKEDIGYQKFDCCSHTIGYKHIEAIGIKAIGIKIILTPFGPAIQDVCIDCYQTALDVMLKKKITLYHSTAQPVSETATND